MKYNSDFKTICAMILFCVVLFSGVIYSRDGEHRKNEWTDNSTISSCFLREGKIYIKKCTRPLSQVGSGNINDVNASDRMCSPTRYDSYNNVWRKKYTHGRSDFNCTTEALPINFKVKHLFFSDSELYYMGFEDDESLFAGYYNVQSGLKFSDKIPADHDIKKIIKLSGFKGVIYFQTAHNKLYRVSLNKINLSVKDNVLDYDLINGKVVYVEIPEQQRYLNFNGNRIPISINGDIRIKDSLDCRMIFVTNGNETEVVDVSVMKNLYQYSRKGKYIIPGKYNVLINLTDNFNEKIRRIDEKYVFYKMYINGKYIGRTGTGMSFSARQSKLNLVSGRYHIIRTERWELNSKLKRYFRSNNIYQPKPMRLFIPENRVIRIDVIFDGKKYRYKKLPMYQ
ncbi:hypothetical protein ACFL20_06665 [Spirochaetota bacterium]